MKILHIVNDLETGGAQSLIENLVSFQAERHEVQVICLARRGALSARIEEKATTLHLGVSLRRPLTILSGLRRARRIARSWRPDIVHSHLFQSNLMGLILRGPEQVWTIHTSGHGANDKFATRVVVAALARTVRRGRRVSIVACSPSADRYSASVFGRPADAVILNGVAIGQALGQSSRTGALRILSLARFHPMKDHATLFRAVGEMTRPATLTCAGNGTEFLDKLADFPAIDECTSLVGSVSDPDRLLANADVLVFSSSYGEALPMAGVEALAASVPVLTTDVGDCGMLAIEDWMLVRTGDYRGLARALDRLADLSANDRNNLRHQSYAHAINAFDIRLAVASYDQIYSVAVES